VIGKGIPFQFQFYTSKRIPTGIYFRILSNSHWRLKLKFHQENRMKIYCEFRIYSIFIHKIELPVRYILEFPRILVLFSWWKFYLMDFTLNRALSKKNCSRFPILLLRLNHLSKRTLWTYLVLGGVHPAGHRRHPKFCYFLNFVGCTLLWTVISRDLFDRFGREYARWKGQIVNF